MLRFPLVRDLPWALGSFLTATQERRYSDAVSQIKALFGPGVEDLHKVPWPVGEELQ